MAANNKTTTVKQLTDNVATTHAAEQRAQKAYVAAARFFQRAEAALRKAKEDARKAQAAMFEAIKDPL